ncbi:4-formylbenzenesulfonate dehydrogenase TsaC1/TsaC2 [Pseudocercospora fuligena]|uniref:4-formylbenzenesulfonate dehydrogenase TsaC1/TsaC2 n=1 Tax=Pseudocercospora fuligena TaxID=685502 RepID=A0A8H6RBZ0_9PEZI|nr:4-formylbenzenesulfonate dehydrogenase TsaC1/TsaC2 [Pseudocercospora fuligena]
MAQATHTGRLHDKVAIITGGGMGLGEGIVRKFVHEGCRVVIFELDPSAGTKVASTLPLDRIHLFTGNVTNENHWKEALKCAVDAFGKLDIVVDNAGVVHNAQPSPTVPRSEYDRIMEVNVSPLYLSSKIIGPYFQSQKSGCFVNISSISAPRPRPNLVWYAGSKGAVTAITKGLAAEFAKDGIRCNAICPVAADTGMMKSVLGGEDTPEGRAVIVKGIPMGRVATPEDVGNAAAFLASDEASFITGVDLPVDGGRALM